MKNIITASALALIIILQILTLVGSSKGDMNNDGILNITDLSILASVINEQG